MKSLMLILPLGLFLSGLLLFGSRAVATAPRTAIVAATLLTTPAVAQEQGRPTLPVAHPVVNAELQAYRAELAHYLTDALHLQPHQIGALREALAFGELLPEPNAPTATRGADLTPADILHLTLTVKQETALRQLLETSPRLAHLQTLALVR